VEQGPEQGVRLRAGAVGFCYHQKQIVIAALQAAIGDLQGGFVSYNRLGVSCACMRSKPLDSPPASGIIQDGWPWRSKRNEIAQNRG
jgi:hypothetical protein